MVEQQRSAIVQTAEISRLRLMAKDLVPEVTSDGIFRTKRKLVGPVFDLIKACDFCTLVALALKPTQRVNFVQRRETMSH